jgi:hypothetical protein
MFEWRDFRSVFGFRRKKTFVDKVQDYAGDVMSTVSPMLNAPVKVANKALGRRDNLAERARYRTAKLGGKLAGRSSKAAGRAWSFTQDSASTSAEHIAPVLAASSKVASRAANVTADTAAAGLSRFRRRREAVAEKSAAAASAVGSFFGSLFAFIWGTIVFLFKTALLAGVAYVGWQWLQSRQQNQTWRAPTYTPPSTGSTSSFGSSYSTPSSTPVAAGR